MHCNNNSVKMFEKLLNGIHDGHLPHYPSFLALAIFLFCVYLIIQKLFSPGQNETLLPPSPPKLPFIGNLHQVAGRLPHHSLASLSNKYGQLMSLQLGYKPAVVISSAAVVREIVKNGDIPFASKPAQIATEKLFYGRKDLIFSPYGDHWRKLRGLFINHLLHKRMITSFKSIRTEEVSNLVENINELIVGSAEAVPPVAINLSAMISSLANDVVCKAAFGKKYVKGEEGKMIMAMIEETVQFLFKLTVGEFIPWLAWTNRWSGFEAAMDKLAKTKDEILDSKIQEYLEASISGALDRDGCEDNFADILCGIYNGNIPGMSIDMDMAKAIIQDVLGAGTDTTAAALGWAMTELIRHPKIMKKLQDEVRGTIHGKQAPMITEDELDKMQYLKAVVKEALRLHAPVAVNLRETIEEVQLMGYKIPSGTMVMFNLWAICRDPAYWDEPAEFVPERFLNSSVDYKGFDFQFVPFGCGRRTCPGISFSAGTTELVLANLMHKFDWKLPNGVKGEDLDVIEKPGLVVGRKNPLIVVPTKCSP